MIFKKWLLAAVVSGSFVGAAQALAPVSAGTTMAVPYIGYNVLTNTDLALGGQLYSGAGTYHWALVPNTSSNPIFFSGYTGTVTEQVDFTLQSTTPGQGFGVVSVDSSLGGYVHAASLYPTLTIGVAQLGIGSTTPVGTNGSWEMNYTPYPVQWSFDGKGLTSLQIVMSWSVRGDCYQGLSDCAYIATPQFDVGAQLTAAAVPEPETYGMMLAGLGAMGCIARRKRSV